MTLYTNDTHLAALSFDRTTLWTSSEGTAWVQTRLPFGPRRLVAAGGSFLAAGTDSAGGVAVSQITPPG